MDETLSEKIRNYFTDRIEEIKEGTFFPSYDQVKNLPEFSGINRDEFIIARNDWYKQTFHMTLNEYSSRLVEEKFRNYFTDRIEEIKEGTFVPSYDQVKDLPEFSGINRDEFIIARNDWYKQTFRMNFKKFSSYLASGLSAEEYVLKLRRKLKGKRIKGLCFLIPGVILIVMFLYVGVMSRWSRSVVAWYGGALGFGIILLVIGIILIIYYSIKGKRKKALMANFP